MPNNDPAQDAINRLEWENPENWSGPIYFSKRDTRTWVPKSLPAFGWTLNLGKKAGVCWFLGILLLPTLFLLVLLFS